MNLQPQISYHQPSSHSKIYYEELFNHNNLQLCILFLRLLPLVKPQQ